MNLQRWATVATGWCATVILAGWVVTWIAALGSASIENTGAAPVVDHRAPSFIADAELVDPAATATGNAAVAKADAAMAAEPARGTHTTAAPDEPEAIDGAALTESMQTMLPPDTPPVQLATASTPDPVLNGAREAVRPFEIPRECLAAGICIDRYLWALYERTPKEDSIKLQERRKVTVKKKGKTVTVTKSFTKLVDEDFTWKDPKAAKKAGMPMMEYVIGGMDRSFKLKLFHLLRAAEEAGLSPGITSAFRDDYRQSLASGLKAATNKSFHGGSSRGGYGHGLAADIVSIEGETRDERWNSSANLWKWIDAHGKEFGIGRPYLRKDPPHVAPIDGQEYAAHHRRTKTQQAGSDLKEPNGLALRDGHTVAKHRKTTRSSKVRTI